MGAFDWLKRTHVLLARVAIGMHALYKFVAAAELLKRTQENRDRRYKERLNDYYKRNFKVCPA